MGQWGREAIDNGTMDVGTLETRTMGPWDNENGTVGHWRIAYWALGQCASGAMGREGHGRRDNAQQDNAMDHLPSMHECLSVLLPQLNSWTNGEGPRPTEPGIAGSIPAGFIFACVCSNMA